MRMRAAALAVAVFLSLPLTPARVHAACTPCVFAGLCNGQKPCTPSEARCAPTGGIIGFNSLPPNVPVYWDFFIDTRTKARARFAGRLTAWADYSAGVPAVPDFPAQCPVPPGERFPTCFGVETQLRTKVRRDRLVGRAAYPHGDCSFNFALAFGTERDGIPNGFACRDTAGVVTSEGKLRVQLLRVLGCRR